MKVQHVNIKEFKKLQNIDAEIAGRNIWLVGENGVGKSSFIQFIEIALGKSTNIPPDALGEGYVITDKDGQQYTLKVKVKDGKSKVTIIGPDGMKDDRKSTLATLMGAMDFDIDEFVELSKTTSGQKKQVELFKSFLPKDVQEELVRHEVNNKTKFDERTELNRDIKKLDTEINTHPLTNIMDLKQFQPVDVTKVYEDLKSANTHNERVAGIEQGMADKKKEIEEIEAKLAQLKIDQARGEEWLKKNQKIDISGFEATIQGANEANTKHAQAHDLIKKRDLLKTMTDEAEGLTVLIETGRQAITDAIRDMDSPVEGLGFDEEKLIYNGIPVNPDSLSTSEIMELGIRLKMAENPDLGVLFIQRGESLGVARLKEIQTLADTNGWQIICEEVRRGQEKLQIELMEG